jgi:uncharacterized repeat protein (TIGR04138 family)
MDPNEVLRQITKEDKRYSQEAYFFVYRALSFCANRLEREAPPGHVTGRELLDGIRDLAKKEFGFLAKLVFNSWGVHSTRDFGNIVFNLVARELMGAREDDRVEDFEDGFDFTEAFEADLEIDFRSL